jgi:hypothetical protein
MKSIRYFAYGSNMLSQWLTTRCKSALVHGIASVAGYTLAFSKKSIDGSGKAMLVPSADPASKVYGVVFDIPESEMGELDRSEGRGKGYERSQDFAVTALADGETLRIMTYMADAKSVLRGRVTSTRISIPTFPASATRTPSGASSRYRKEQQQQFPSRKSTRSAKSRTTERPWKWRSMKSYSSSRRLMKAAIGRMSRLSLCP